jgi:hypothetical protein
VQIINLVLADSFRFQKPTNAKPETFGGQAKMKEEKKIII